MNFKKVSISGSRAKASVLHLGVSVIVAVLSAALVFLLWYPYPYREISGGRELFLILVSVDVIIGPLITLAIFDIEKPKRELRRDLLLVVLFQLIALGYGLRTMAMARPVHLVFEIDRFRVVHAVDIPPELVNKTPANIEVFPIGGPTLLGIRSFNSEKEKMDATLAALQGLQLSYRPEFWQTYDRSRGDVLRIAEPIDKLKARFPKYIHDIDMAMAASASVQASAMYVPLAGRKDFWTVIIDGRNGEVLGYVPLDSF